MIAGGNFVLHRSDDSEVWRMPNLPTCSFELGLPASLIIVRYRTTIRRQSRPNTTAMDGCSVGQLDSLSFGASAREPVRWRSRSTNPDYAERVGTITIGDKTLTILQGGQRAESATLLPGEKLFGGQRLVSGPYRLENQETDGNLVVYQNGDALWSIGVTDHRPGYAVMQGDGNFVGATTDMGASTSTHARRSGGVWIHPRLTG